MSIEAAVSRIVAEANAVEINGRGEARVIALLDVLLTEFPDVPIGQMMVSLADLLGRLAAKNGANKTATTLCTIILLRAAEKRG